MKYLINGADKLAAIPDFKLIGREIELERLSSILMRDKSNSVLLTGPGGVGCSSLCLGLQEMKSNPDAPFDIVSKRLFWLDSDELFQSGDTTTINENFLKISAVLKRTPDSILIINDAKEFIEAMRNSGTNHFLNSLHSMIKSNYTQVILVTRDEDLDMVLKSHSDINEYYTMLDLAEPVNGVLEKIIEQTSKGLVKHHGIQISNDALIAAIEVTSKYRTRDMGLSRAQPERAITLLDRALSTFRLNAHKCHPKVPILRVSLSTANETNKKAIEIEINKLNEEFRSTQAEIKQLFKFQRDGETAIVELEEQLLEQLNKEKEAREKGEATEVKKFSSIANLGGFESEAVRAIRNQITQYQKLVDDNKTKFDELTKKINEQLEMSKSDVLSEFSKISGISANKLDEDERVKLKNLESDMLTRIFGQNHAVKRLSDAVKIAKIGRRNKGKPMAAFMYLGPSGVGKTEIAKVLSQFLLDDESALTRFDMSEYMEKHAVAKLIGAPPGYEGFEAGGILTNALRKNPHRIILFDEIEKAHPDVYNIMLQILSDGRLTDNVGRTVSFEHTIIIMTTNIGQPHFLNAEIDFEEAQKRAISDLDGTYRSEFLNRFAGRQNIICFNRLELDSIEKIVSREIHSLKMSYIDQGINVEMSGEDLKSFCRDHYNPVIGARGLPGYIQANLEPIITNTILENPNFVGDFIIGYDEKKKTFTHSLIGK